MGSVYRMGSALARNRKFNYRGFPFLYGVWPAGVVGAGVTTFPVLVTMMVPTVTTISLAGPGVEGSKLTVN